MFQSPSLRGSGRFREPCYVLLEAWLKFQSPSLRGSGRFLAITIVVLIIINLFQSPSLRGSGRFFDDFFFIVDVVLVSIPFIAGQWSLPNVFRN